MKSELTYAYYPGCSGLGTSIEYEISTRACCRALGIELVELDDWSCCGSTPAHTFDHLLAAALAARNLNIVKQMGMKSVLTPCPSCLSALRKADYRMKDPKFKEKVNALLDTPYNGGIEAKSVLQVIFEEIGTEKIAEKVKRPMKGLKVAPYYGCIINRPPEVMAFDDPENPVAMDRILEAVGAEVVQFPFKVECCGAAHGVPRRDVVMFLSSKIISMAQDAGANSIAVCCPMCHQNLDLRQDQINAYRGTNFRMPIFYFTQILGLSLGFNERELGLDKHNVSPKEILREIESVSVIK
jgi:heterodisulfide reductase subunit B